MNKLEEYKICQDRGHTPVIITKNSTGPYTCTRCGTTYRVKVEINEVNPPKEAKNVTNLPA